MTAGTPAAGREVRTLRHLREGWELAASAPGCPTTPEDLVEAGLAWHPAVVPGTVAQSLGLDPGDLRDLDGEAWWYRCRFPAEAPAPGTRIRLRCEGLATLAEVWLNGQRLAESRTMFRALVCDITDCLQASNELVLRFQALRPELAVRRRRPRWRTGLVADQNLRWIRTTLLGRMPGWSPALPPVGPWREVVLETHRHLAVEALDLQTGWRDGEGWASLCAVLRSLDGHDLEGAVLVVGGRRLPLAVTEAEPGLWRATGDGPVPGLAPWFPHTHGDPALHEARLEVATPGGLVSLACGRVGFKSIALVEDPRRTSLLVNGRPVFVRGACWTAEAFPALSADPERLRRTLTQAREAGMNLLRVGGTMAYESEAFYALCDELGLLVWQDFMFANMDYPFQDEAFHAEARAEVEGQLARLQRHPCIAVYCGGSEIEQQAAMLGLPAAEWSDPFFSDELPRCCEAFHRGIPYLPSTPTGGVMPFHLQAGVSHYYGVGAYLRPLEDVKHAGVRFTPECLGFANLPEEETLEEAFGLGTPPTHHPRWKAGVPRDAGMGWDFEDVRDHYLALLHGVDPVKLRSHDPARYFAISRAVTGDVMAAVFAEWRRAEDPCGGGLVWFLKDLCPGAGWGLIDHRGRPKAAYWHLRRAWARQALLLTDEGLEGLRVHLHNEVPQAQEGVLEVELFRAGRIPVGRAERPVTVPAFGALAIPAESVLGYFADLTSAYRFGPPKQDLVVARWRSPEGAVLGEAIHLPGGRALPFQDPAAVELSVEAGDRGHRILTLRTRAFLQGLALAAPGYQPEDNHFHLAPGQARRVGFHPEAAGPGPFKVHVAALNLADPLTARDGG